MVQDKAIIQIHDVSFSYNGMNVVEDVNLEVQDRDFLSIVGPNGGGKTTLIKLILGLLKPQKGTLRVFGLSPARARPRIGYMPQHASLDPLFPVTSMDVVLMGRLGSGRSRGFFNAVDREKARQSLEMVELHEARNRSFAELSGGQRQRVLIARALVSEPDLLILDEPTSNVDAALEVELFELLVRLNEHMTVLVVNHDLGFVSRYVKSVACVNRRVVTHPTSEITGEMIHELYGHDVRMVRHDTLTYEKG
jgi:zinc transport system ATP-binding protein